MHISTANCTEITRDKPEQPVYEIFDIKRRFNGPSINLIGSKLPAHEGIKDGCPLKVLILLLSAAQDQLCPLASENEMLY